MHLSLPYFTVAPFILLLLCIAVLPLAAPHWWEHNRNKGIVAAVLGVPVAIYFALQGAAGVHELLHKAKEYLSFILLLGSLFIVTSGVLVRGSLSGTPLLNTALLTVGAVLASFIGTTGASVLLIRPYLRANKTRIRRSHLVVFFIFIVSNCGGLLTPLGDPPLFLGFLMGVPFGWTLQLWKEWAFVNFVLLLLFMIVDQIIFDREEKDRAGSQLEQVMVHEPLRVEGFHHLLFLALIVGIIYGAGTGLLNGGEAWPFGVQEGAMFLVALASYLTTSAETRAANRFSFGPITEVAVLFAGIFVTMTPALLLLNAHGAELGLHSPWQFFWVSGILSSFLDNAPTYLTFAATASGMEGIALEGKYLAQLLAKGPAAQLILMAISCGSVFMGANTYIGNGPNFMIKAIAEESGIRMPSFFGYMMWSCLILIPTFVVATFLFFV